MRFDLTVDKKAEASIDDRLCMNCGKCGEICPTGAIDEYRRTVCRLFPRGSWRGASAAVGGESAVSFREARRMAVETGCRESCPLGIVPQAIASLVKSGDVESAREMIEEKNPMPWVCASLCENPCGDQCARGRLIDEPLNMRGLEGYVLNSVGETMPKHVRRFDSEVAIIGGGPAGLAAAFRLSGAGYGVTVFEKDGSPGGALRWGVPDFRLSREKLTAETGRIAAAGVEIRCGYEIGRDHTLEDLRGQGFAACLIAVGASEGMTPQIPGGDAQGIYDAVRVMRQINGGEDEGIQLGERIAVIGRGRLVVNTARLLRRMGKIVTCAVVESDDEPEMSEGSFQAMVGEGIDLRTGAVAKQIISEGGQVKAVELVKAGYTMDGNGMRKLQIIKGSETNLFCDTVIFADGRRCAASELGNMETHPGGRVRVDERYRTNKDMIFACGDAIGQCGSVAEAMASGKAAAAEIDRTLRENFFPKRKTAVKNAPDSAIIYAENVRDMIPQTEDAVTDEDRINGTVDHTEDIMPLLRAAGIGKELERFSQLDEDGRPKRKIAVIGGGIAGMTAALDLAGEGYAPTILEKEHALGGSYRWLASCKRVDKELLDRETKKISDAGIDVVYGVAAGAFPNIKGLFSMGYEAVLFAIGESTGRRPPMKNVRCRGVFEIVSLMGKLLDNERVADVGKQVIVAGYDELAFDTARLLKQFCQQVTVLSPMSKGKLKASVASVAAALDEGVHLVTGAEPVEIEAQNGRLTGVKCRIKEKNMMLDITCDTLVLGGTQSPDTAAVATANPDLDMDDRGYIQTDDKLITSIYGVFAIGDFDMTSVEAGHAGAAAVKTFMESGEFRAVGKLREAEAPLTGASVKYEIFEGRGAAGNGQMEVGRRPLDKYRAEAEASRCMECGYCGETAGRCIGCGVCAEVCPVRAITFKAVATAGEEEVRS